MAEPTDDIPLFEIDWKESDIKNIERSIRRGNYWAKGPYNSKFESKLEEYLNVKHALVVNSGTTALVAALKSLGIGKNDEVIIPSFTFIATANAVRLVGAEPVFADIEPNTYGLDPEDVKTRITENTAGILPVHCYGTSCRIHELCEIASENGIHLIEDAAEVLGAEYDGKKLGTFGNVAALSFCQNKIVSTGEGGAVVTNNDDLAERIRLYRSHGRASKNYFESSESGQYIDIGTNIRMSDITSALGCSQLDRIGTIIEGRQKAAKQLTTGLKSISGVQPHSSLNNATHVYQLYTVELSQSIERGEVIATLEEQGIASKIYWDPGVHRTKYYREYKHTVPELPVTESVTGRVLSLPIHPNLTSKETKRIVAAVADAVK